MHNEFSKDGAETMEKCLSLVRRLGSRMTRRGSRIRTWTLGAALLVAGLWYAANPVAGQDTGLVPPDAGLFPPDTGLVDPNTGLPVLDIPGVTTAEKPKVVIPDGLKKTFCYVCHSNENMGVSVKEWTLEQKIKAEYITSGPAELAETRPADYHEKVVVLKDAFEHSAHGQLECLECHDTITTIPHPQFIPNVKCDTCHEEEQKAWEGGRHGNAFNAMDSDAPDCNKCHGNYHTLLPQTKPGAVIHRSNIPNLCGSCHGDAGVLKRHPDLKQDAVEGYWNDVHGHGFRVAGLTASATCRDCHDRHRNLKVDDKASSMSAMNTVGTCGACHGAVSTVFAASIHGTKLLDEGIEDAPGCNECHPGHATLQVATTAYRLGIVEDCAECHNEEERGKDRLDTYRETYHGKAEKHGSLDVATCADCHEFHNVHELASTSSTIHLANRVETCRPCHPYANEKFVAFLPHLHFDDKDFPQTYYPWLFMTLLLLGTMGFFVVHSFLWFVREIPLIAKRKRLATSGEPVHYQRFTLVHRITHAILFISVIGLAATGLPLRYPDAPWSAWAFTVFGGVKTAGVFHRIFAALTILYVGIHFVYLWKVWRRRPKRPFWKTVFGSTSLIPNWTDVKQFFQHVRWMLFLGPHPRFGRWTYWDKFDYWAVFWGVAIIGASGAVMLFSPQIAPYVPGWVFNIALIIHSDEALLAASFLFAIHFFHVHLRPLKFPIDHVMFSGTMTQGEMEEERPLELERLEADGTLEEARAAAPNATQLVVNRVIAFVALAVGLAFLAGLVWSEIIVRLT